MSVKIEFLSSFLSLNQKKYLLLVTSFVQVFTSTREIQNKINLFAFNSAFPKQQNKNEEKFSQVNRFHTPLKKYAQK